MAENDFVNNFYEEKTDPQASVEAGCVPSIVENVSGFGYYKKCLQHYADFGGRARRKEFWFFFLFNMLFAFAAAIIDNILGVAFMGAYGLIFIVCTLWRF
jgi:hypothetical protein